MPEVDAKLSRTYTYSDMGEALAIGHEAGENEEKFTAAESELDRWIAEQPDVPNPEILSVQRSALEAALYWLEEERANPGQAEPDEILRVIEAALGVTSDSDREDRRRQIVDLAQSSVGITDKLEIDEDAAVDEGTLNGAFVHAWVWVDFANSPLDKGLNQPSSL